MKDPRAEKLVLGTSMADTAAFIKAAAIVKQKFFSTPQHQWTWEAICDAYNGHRETNVSLVIRSFTNKHTLSELGDEGYIATLAAYVDVPCLISNAERVAECWGAREVNRVTAHYQQLMASGVNTLSHSREMMDAHRAIHKEIIYDKGKTEYEVAQEVAKESRENAANNVQLLGMPCGIPALDQLFSGWQTGIRYDIYARPSMGKTAFGIFLKKQWEAQGFPGKYRSTESSIKQIFTREASAATNRSVYDVRLGKLNDYEWKKFEELVQSKKGATSIVDGTKDKSFEQDLQELERDVYETGIKWYIYDYVQNSFCEKRYKSRRDELGYMGESLIRAADRLDICIVMLSQVKREVEERADKRPRYGDMSESDILSRQCDIGMGLFRPSRYGLDTDEEGRLYPENYTEGVISKQRDGDIGEVGMLFNGTTFAPFTGHFMLPDSLKAPKA